MTAIICCLSALITCYIAGTYALWTGFLATILVGYLYGIVRANLESSFAHFIFDFGAIGFYCSLLTRNDSPIERFKMRRIMPWVLALAGWSLILVIAPQQTLLVRLVGLRGQVFFLPFLLVGAVLSGSDMSKIAIGLAVFSFIEVAFALLEIQFGLQRFYPVNAVDQIIYNSMDVSVGSSMAFRIPATFPNAAAFGGNMAYSIPLLLGAMVQERAGGLRRIILLVALGAAAAGVFLSASRSQATLLFILTISATLSGRVRNFPWFGWVGLLGVLGILVATSPRMQRFVSLQDTSYVKKRVSGSVNANFLDLALKYPLGNGLGGGGTSMPYFLQSQLRNPVAIEDEYGRIMLEEGLPGLVLWLVFIFWVLNRPFPKESEPWYLGKWLARVVLAYSFVVALTGTGLLTSIPGTATVLLFSGWIASPNIIYRGTKNRSFVSGRIVEPSGGVA